jgi:hypothetical protein
MPSSLPALIAGMLQSDKTWHVRSDAGRFESAPIVPAYAIDPALSVEAQAERVAQSVSELAAKIGRLKEAYGSWPLFEPGPYFDFYPAQLVSLCRVEETRRIVRVRLYADLLLPAFRAAERFWVDSFLPAYHAGFGGANLGGDAFRTHVLEETAPHLGELLAEAERGIQAALERLSDNWPVLSLLGGLEERIQHRPAPGMRMAAGLPPALQRLPREMPTLTLDTIYPAPRRRPPGAEAWLEYRENAMRES